MSFRRVLFAVCLMLLVTPAWAEPTVELLTMGPGDGMLERFGHAALRVHEGRHDLVYSYGVAPFSRPSFLLESLRGTADYFIVAAPFADTLAAYQRADRTVIGQELALPRDAKRWLILELQRAARPPDNHYRYDHLYDNCSTRIRDLLDSASHGALRRAAADRKPDHRFRDDTLAAESGHLFASWGFDLIGGPHQDQLVADGYQEMYLPEYLRARVAEAQLELGAERRPLAGPSRVLYERKAQPARWSHREFPRGVLFTLSVGLLLLLAASVVCMQRAAPVPVGLRRALGLWLGALCAVCGLFGLVEVPFRILAGFHDARANENVWLFFPLDLLLLVPLYRCAVTTAALPPWLRLYVAARAGCVSLVLLLKLVGLLPQHNGYFLLTACAWALGSVYLAAVCARVSPWAKDRSAADCRNVRS